jgi:hypothetical protein
LLAEVYREDVDELVAAAPALLAEHEPLTALACWFDRVASYARIKRGVFAAVEAGVSQVLAAHSLGPIGEAITVLLDAGKADGTIRPDVDARDVILLIGYLTRLEQDITDAGRPILDVDHIQDLAKGGPDHPEQMIALCPNCHAIKTRGRTREQLRQELFTVARQRHEAILSR